ncbi:hypothetical protein F4821DRAFT_265187 [Hypoxylon rubiginosum]|uniref:Uncharacterized protein n=1 Tax=Hypoxylon rubiginosum TaxID=110542 RepID=A0ACC0CLD4_9PEZI|nr:hypothetical protein F4821DRAFT_265187 [Hypoxylon rubiginosum]
MLSPSSDAFSHSQMDSQQRDHGSSRANGLTKRPKRPSNAFEIYCNDTRPVLQSQHKDKIAAGEFRASSARNELGTPPCPSRHPRQNPWSSRSHQPHLGVVVTNTAP